MEIAHSNINHELCHDYLEIDGKLFPEVTEVGIMTMGDGRSVLLPSLMLSGGWGSSPRAGKGKGLRQCPVLPGQTLLE